MFGSFARSGSSKQQVTVRDRPAATSESAGAWSAALLLSGNLETVFTDVPSSGLGRACGGGKGGGQRRGFRKQIQCNPKEKDQIQQLLCGIYLKKVKTKVKGTIK